MDRVEGNIIHGVDQGLILARGGLVSTVAFEREVIPGV
jgi:hypothetical protein